MLDLKGMSVTFGKKKYGIIPFIRRIVTLDKISYIDLSFPGLTLKVIPALILKFHKQSYLIPHFYRHKGKTFILMFL